MHGLLRTCFDDKYFAIQLFFLVSTNNFNINHKIKIKQRQQGCTYFNLAAYENLLVDAKDKRTMIQRRTSLIFMTSCLKSRRLAASACSSKLIK